jgi:hypothetical protein
MNFKDVWAVTWPLLTAGVFLWRYKRHRDSSLLLVVGFFAALAVVMLLVQLFFRK